MDFPGGSDDKESTAMQERQETWVWSLSQEDQLEKETATHSSSPAWSIPCTEEPDGLQSIGFQRGDTTEWPTHSLVWNEGILTFYVIHYYFFFSTVIYYVIYMPDMRSETHSD